MAMLLPLFVSASAVNAVNPIPGTLYIGASLHLLNGWDPFGQIVQLSYNFGQQSSAGYDIADTVISVPHSACSYSASGFTIDSYEDFQTESTLSLKIGGSYKMFTGSYSRIAEVVKQSIYKDKRSVSLVTAECVQYELNLIRSGAPLSPWFITEAKLLPSDIDTQFNLDEYFSFFDYYGTHIITGCDIGGKLEQYAFTQETYHKQYGKEKVTQQAQAKFFVSVDGSMSNSVTIDEEYTQSTNTWQVSSIGGIWPDSMDNWIPWIQSVQNLQNVACINWSAREITDVWSWHPDLVSKQSVAQQALIQYFNRIGCVDPTAVNYDNTALVNAGCEYASVPEFRICFQETEGSSQCQGTRASCSAWSSATISSALLLLSSSWWTAEFRDDTDGRDGGCTYQWKVEQQDSGIRYTDYIGYKYRMCFRETEGSSQCQGTRSSCTGWNTDEAWTPYFRDDTDGRDGGCKYQWMMQQIADSSAPIVNECRICFQEIEAGDGQCQGARSTCTGWSKSSPGWSDPFRDDTDDREGGCKYQWLLQCQ